MAIEKAMVLAAGQGSRLRPLTDHVPKPMLPVGGVPLLEHTIRRLVQYGIYETVINLHHEPQSVMKYFGDGARHGIRIVYSYEPELLGTAGAVKRMESFFRDGTFIVLYGDNLTTCDFGRLEWFHRRRGGIATVALFWKEDVSPHSAVELDLNDRVIHFVEKPKPPDAPSNWISAGVILLEPAALQYIPERRPFDFGYDLFPELLQRDQSVYGYRMSEGEGLWWIDTPLDYERICTLWKESSTR